MDVKLRLSSVVVLLLGLSSIGYSVRNSLDITVQPSKDIIAGAVIAVDGTFSESVRNKTTLTLKCKGQQCHKVLDCESSRECGNQTVKAGSLTVGEIRLVTHEPGVVTLFYEADSAEVNTDKAFVNLSVGQAVWILVVSDIAGWIYFFAWSISFYPQIWSNHARKSVVGLNFDFLALNLTGFLFYTTFSFCLYCLPAIQQEYYQRNPQTHIPVELNDVAFGIHAVFAVIVTVVQCCIYEKGVQKVSYTATIILTVAWTTAGILFVAVLIGMLSQLSYLYYFSYCKVAITVCKYMPQAFYNYKRKSTVGWSIGNILLDFCGGLLSIMQMFLLSYNYNDWSSIFTNFSKFGIGMISIGFDILFIVQHYCLYPEDKLKKLENHHFVKPLPLITQERI